MTTQLLSTTSPKYLKRLVREINGVVQGGGSAYGVVAHGDKQDNAVKIMLARLELNATLTALEVGTGKRIIINPVKPIIDHRGQDIVASRIP